MLCVKCLFDNTGALVNRIEYDRLGNIRNEETEPQIDILFKKGFYVKDIGLYIGRGGAVYSPEEGQYLPCFGNPGLSLEPDELNTMSGSGDPSTFGHAGWHVSGGWQESANGGFVDFGFGFMIELTYKLLRSRGSFYYFLGSVCRALANWEREVGKQNIRLHNDYSFWIEASQGVFGYGAWESGSVAAGALVVAYSVVCFQDNIDSKMFDWTACYSNELLWLAVAEECEWRGRMTIGLSIP